MITYSGIHIQKIGGADGTPSPLDIAVHAGRLCRFGGAVWAPLLPHLVFVGLLAYRRSGSLYNLLWGFLHDAHECVTNDVPRPFKCGCMKTEQQAIDERILAEYFTPQGQTCIDFELIHQCDIDACDVEATELGVPNYREITSNGNCDAAYHHEVNDSEADRRLFQRLRHSAFYINTISDKSVGVQNFRNALEEVKAGNLDGFWKHVDSWGLL